MSSMKVRQRADAGKRLTPLAFAARLMALGALAFAATEGRPARADTVVTPGASGPIAVSDGTTTTVPGNTQVTATTGSAINVTNGAAVLNGAYSGFPAGPITVNGLSAPAVLADGRGAGTATITIVGGVSIATTNGGVGMLAHGANASIAATNVAVSTAGAGSGAHGILAQQGGQVALHGTSTVASTQQGAIGIGSSSGGLLTADAPVSISLSGNNATGMYAHDGGQLQLAPGTTVTLTGSGGAGAIADNTVLSGASTLRNLTINLNAPATAGNGGAGLVALNGATVNADNLTVQGANAGAGVVAYGGAAGSGQQQTSVTLTGGNITISSGNNTSVWYLPTGAADFVNPNGAAGGFGALGSSPSAGLRATANPSFGTPAATSVINAVDTVINVTPANGVGATAGASGGIGLNTINLTRGSVTTSGNNSVGLQATSNGMVNADSTVVRSAGGGAALNAISADRGGTPVVPSLTAAQINLTNADVLGIGGTIGLYANNFSQAQTSLVNVSGGQLRSEASYGVYAVGPLNVNFSNGAVVAGQSGYLFRASPNTFGQPTVVALRATGASVLNGDALADPGTTATFDLQTGSHWTGASQVARPLTSVSLDATSTWTVTNDSAIAQTLGNAGLVRFVPPGTGPFHTVTAGNYAGGGVLAVNTYLGADGSASDKLVVNGGTASGQTRVRVTNAGGPGALTTQNGIVVVDAINGGSTGAGAFVLDGRAVAGPYEYRLFRSSLDGSNAQAWYLRSEQVPPTPPTPPTPPAPPAPLYRAEVGAYLANQRIATGFLVHSLHDRLGEPQWAEQQTFDNDDAKRGSGWVRLVGKDVGSRSRDGNFDVSSTVWMLQGGGEVAQWSVFRGDDRLHLGGMLGYSWGSSDGRAAGNPATATSDVQGVNVGLYGTWFQNDETRLGWYTDLWGQYGWYANHVNGEALPSVQYNSRLLALSAESGYAWHPRLEKDWVIEPQGQVIYVHGFQGSFNEANGTHVGDAQGSGWITRLGVRLHRTWIHDGGQRTQPYLTLNWWHDAVDNAIAFNQVSLRDLYPQNRYEVKLGINLERGKGWTGWSNVGWQFGSQSYHAFIGRLGVKYTW